MGDLKEAGLTLPKRVQDVIAERKRREPVFVSDPEDVPHEEGGKAYCADGDNTKVESRSLQRCITDKAQKFNADGYHLVVLATLRPGFPSHHAVFDALYGQSPHIKHHGLFESGLHNEICGVIYLPVCQQLYRLKGATGMESTAVLFPNHNAAIRLSAQLQKEVARVFGAEIREGWGVT